MSTHRVLRVHGGRLVVSERRVELEDALDELGARGFALVTSFVVDDNVYLVLRGPDESTDDRLDMPDRVAERSPDARPRTR